MSITDKLQTLNTIKADIKTAINSKGGNVGDDFTTYATAINNIETGGGSGDGSAVTIKPGVLESLFKNGSIDKGSSLIIDCTGLNNASSMFETANFGDGIIPKLINISDIRYMTNMFAKCTSLTTIPLLDTSNVTGMYGIFSQCSSLTTIPLLDTSNVTIMSSMFAKCTSLTTMPLLDTNKVTDMQHMFNWCTSLTTIPELDTNNVTKMNFMFSYCTSLTTIPLLDTNKVTDMQYMFYDCTSLTTIPLLDASNVTNTSSMFGYCSNLTNVGGFINLSEKLPLAESPLLTRESVLNIFNNLATVTVDTNIYLHPDVKARLTNDDIAIATSKGWIVS